MINYVIQKRLVFPNIYSSGNGNTIVYKIDNALMSAGFKLSHNLFVYLKSLNETDALQAGMTLIGSLDKLVGNHIKHNTYFKKFPNEIPDTLLFWFSQIIQLFLTGDHTYGNYQHSYEDMLGCHASFNDKFGTNYKVIHLGESLNVELVRLYQDLAGSRIPLSPDDRALLSLLVAGNHIDTKVDIPIRENRAIINLSLIREKKPLNIDTLTDVLRLAVALSNGDITLEKNTKIVSLSKYIRKTLLYYIDQIIKKDVSKVEDIFLYQEAWKRLGEKLHPHEYVYENAKYTFCVVRGDIKYNRWAGKVQSNLLYGDYHSAITLLSEKPGYLFRNIDRIARNCSDKEFNELINAMSKTGNKVSTRVLLSLREFMMNRHTSPYRVFVNYKGKAHVENNDLGHISGVKINRICSIIDCLIVDKLPKNDLILDLRLKEFSSVSLPISEKNKSEGFDVLPRGSTITVGKDRKVIRFFVYWKQKNIRTDYDLSCVFYNKIFKPTSQVSWTNLRSGFSYHSGDLTDGRNGASEFIDIKLDEMPDDIYYFIPTVNIYNGEQFSETEECFFGYMERDLKEFGKPFEAKTVKTKFSMRGKGKICLPLAFHKDGDEATVKWMDLYMKGYEYYNKVEKNCLSTATVAQGIVDRQYLTLDYLLNLYKLAGVNIQYTDQVTSDVIGLNNLSKLII